jgi:predicted amidohydrolase YtcJ
MRNLILINGNVITMDSALPKAHLIVIKNGKIQYVGSNDRLKDLRDPKTNVVDCNNKTILPGFIDAHCHLLGFIESLLALNLQPRNNVRSIHDIQFKIRQLSQTLPPGTWIKGRGYNDFYLEEKRHPTRWDLDVATSIHPIKLTHRSGHAYVLNSLGLKLSNISRETPDPSGGLIDRDIRTGEPTGLIYGMGDYLAKKIPFIDSDQIEYGIKLASTELSSFGITSIHDASPRNNLNRWELFQRWKKDGLLKSRVNMTLGLEGFAEYQRHHFSNQVGKSQLNIKGVKIILQETTGRLYPSQEELNQTVLHVHQFGLQAILHAIEEKTIEAACNAIEFALQKSPRQDHRHRIEHCSICTQSLAKRMASLGIIVVTQPSFIYYNGERYLRTVPNSNLKHIYPIATLLKNGITVAGSSDCPIVPANPLIGIYSAVSRMSENGELILHEEKISSLEAIRMYTEEPAKATFEETMKGSITPGKLADLVVLNGDPTRLPIDEVKDIEVEMTILDGEIVWDKRASQ